MNTIDTSLTYDPILFDKKISASEKTDKVSTEFESLMLYQMLKEMDKTVDRDEGGLLNSEYDKTYRDLFYQEISKEMAKAGGIGLNEVVADEIQAKDLN